MHLFDQIAQATQRKAIRDPVLGDLPIACAPDLKEDVAAAETRYVLQDDVVAFVYDLVLADAALIASSLEILRLPSRTIWLEWRQPDDASDDGGGRLGVLVSAEEDGRRGDCRLVWDVPGAEPNVCGVSVVFDLDGPPGDGDEVGLFPLRHDCPDIDDLLRHFRARVHPGYLRHLLRVHSLPGVKRAVQGPLDAAWLAGPFVAAFCLLLMAGMPLDLKQQSRAALNAKRSKQGRPRLLDHVMVSSNVFPRIAASQTGETPDARRTARLHYVRGHLVRRGTAIFWRRPHLRGQATGAEPHNPVRRLSL